METGTQVAPAAAPATPAVATPPPASPQTPASETIGGTSDAEAQAFAKAFGGTARPQWKDVVTPGAEDAGTATPAEAGHVANAEQTETSTPAANGEAGAQPQGDDFDDEVLKELDQLATRPAKPAPTVAEKPQTGDQPKYDDAALEKRLNPDGKTPVDQQLLNAKKLVVEAQSSIGRQGKELGDARKILADIQRDFLIDPATGKARPVPEAAFNLLDNVPKEEVDRILDQRGYKIVPKDWNGPDSDAANEDALIEAVANELIPGDELDVDGKLAEINSNPKLAAKLLTRVAAKETAEEAKRNTEALQRDQMTAAQRLQAQQDAQQSKARVGEFFTKLKALPYYEKELGPAIQHWNEQLGPTNDQRGNPLPGAIRGEARLQLCYRLAQLDRMPSEIRRVAAKAKEQGEQAALARLGLAQPENSAAPTHVPGRQAGDRRKGEGAPVAVVNEFERAFL